MLTMHEEFNKTKRCQQIADGGIYKFFFFFFFEIKIEILFDKREIHVKTHNNPVSIIQGNKDLFCRKQNMQQNKYSPWTYNTETATDITLSPL